MRDILHCDLNNFFASCECLVNPEIRDKPVAVCGSQKERHGIVLAKNCLAKEMGVKTGQTIWQAEQSCPNLVVVSPNFELYMHFSQKVRNILLQYTDFVEPFGIDESWLDVTNSKIFGSAQEIADEIRQRILNETGLSVSIGISFNKIFAKLGSDLKKPNAVTVITRENFKQKVWGLPVQELLMIGRATTKKLNDMGVYTIGQLAGLQDEFLIKKFGKNGHSLYEYSNGIGNDVVKNYYDFVAPKSIGNSTTCYRDLQNNAEVKEVLCTLAQSVVSRMIESGFIYAKTLKVWVKNNALETFGKQCKINTDSCFSNIVDASYQLFLTLYDWRLPVRALGISVCDFFDGKKQMTLLEKPKTDLTDLDKTILQIKNKFGESVIMQGSGLFDKNLSKPLSGLHSYQNQKKSQL